MTDSSLYIKDLHFNKNTLDIFFSSKLPQSGYKLIIDNGSSLGLVIPSNNTLHIPLQNKIHEYKLVPVQERELEVKLQIDHSQNSPHEFINEFIYCNLPGPQIKVSDYKLWTKGIESFSKSEVESGKEFLKNNTAALLADTDSDRVIEVCRILSMLRPNKNGIKASEASLQRPYQQLLLAMQHKINLDCGNYSAMFYYLCTVLQVPNRVITFAGPAGNWQYGVHYYNEVYLREKQQWTLCDGLAETYMPHDSLRFYNAADIKKMALINGFSNKYVYTYQKDSLREVRYDGLHYWHWYYNRNNANLCYVHPGTGLQNGSWNYLKDFYSFQRNFDFYSDANQNDWSKIFIKMSAFYLLLLVTIFYLIHEIKHFSWRHST